MHSLNQIFDAFTLRIVLIFEGFDEMAMVSNAEMRVAHFKALWQFCYPGAKIVITGRPNFFFDEVEKQKSLGIHQPQGNNPYSEAIKLKPFTITQIKTALRNYKPNVCQQICELADRNTRFLELVSRPSLLHIVADLWEKENLSEKVESLNSADVMGLFVDRSYRRQGRKEGDARRFMALNSAERDYFMQGIATYMAEEELNNQISGEELNRLIDKLVEAIPDSVSTEPPITSGEDKRPLMQKLQVPEDYEDVETDVRTSGLLVDDPAAPNTFKFGHKSFMEYLFARTVLGYLEHPNGSEKARAIFKSTEAQLETLLKLPVSLEFLAEMLCVDQSFRQVESSVLDSTTSPDRVEVAIAVKLLNRIMQKKNQNYKIPMFLVALLFSSKHILDTRTFSYLIRIISRKNYFSTRLVDNEKHLNGSRKRSNFLLDFINFLFLFLVLNLAVYLRLFILIILGLLGASPSLDKFISKISVWNSICKRMNIQDKVLYEVAGIHVLPWIRNKPFDYFLHKSRSNRSDNSGDSTDLT